MAGLSNRYASTTLREKREGWGTRKFKGNGKAKQKQQRKANAAVLKRGARTGGVLSRDD